MNCSLISKTTMRRVELSSPPSPPLPSPPSPPLPLLPSLSSPPFYSYDHNLLALFPGHQLPLIHSMTFVLCPFQVGSSKEWRDVVQFHFTAWPDHGVPQYATAMLAMRRRVRAHYTDVCHEEGPMLVHCSAGVGRTGTFIVMDTMLQRLAQHEDYIDIYGHVSLLRTQRSYMVQTEVRGGSVACSMHESIEVGKGREFA